MKQRKQKMNDDVRMEVIKSLAFGVDIEDIANAAEVTVDEIKAFAEDHAYEIAERKRVSEEFGL